MHAVLHDTIANMEPGLAGDLGSEVIKHYAKDMFDNSGRDFLPDNVPGQLVTPEAIVTELAIDPQDQAALINFIREHADRVFLTAISLSFEPDTLCNVMRRFHDYNFDNSCLPVARCCADPKFRDAFALRCWSERRKLDFSNNQWEVLVPVFNKRGFQYEFKIDHILPFIWVGTESTSGGFGTVVKAIIHEKHQEDPPRDVSRGIFAS